MYVLFWRGRDTEGLKAKLAVVDAHAKDLAKDQAFAVAFLTHKGPLLSSPCTSLLTGSLCIGPMYL